MTMIRVGPTRAYTTIISAFNRAANGDALWIDEGVYDEDIRMDGKVVHLIGNTRYPGEGKVILTNSIVSKPVLYFKNVWLATQSVYIENINIQFPPVSNPGRYDEAVYFYSCETVDFIFNRCIISASNKNFYLFSGYDTYARGVRLRNCRFICYTGNDSDSYSPLYPDFFAFGMQVTDFIIEKSIAPIDLMFVNYYSLPYSTGFLYNLLNTSNTTSAAFTSIGNMFDQNVYNSYSSMPIAAAEYSIITDFGLGLEEIATTLVFRNRTTYYDRFRLSASNDFISWNILFETVDCNEQNAMFRFANDTAYRYYKFEVLDTLYGDGSSYPMGFYIYYLMNKEDSAKDLSTHDFVIQREEYSYGPNYGESLFDIPKQYYFAGNISDIFSTNTLIDSVVLNFYDKSNRISLVDAKQATLPTTYRYEHHGIRATVGRATGKWYWEVVIDDTYGECRCGLGTDSSSLYGALGVDTKSWAYRPRDGGFYTDNVRVKVGESSSPADVIGIAYDAFNSRLWWSKNGEWMLGGDPSMGTNPIFEIDNAELFPMFSLYSSDGYASKVDFLTSYTKLSHPIPEGFSFYGTNSLWNVKAINAVTNQVEGMALSEPLTTDYQVVTTYSGEHFVICEDVASEPIYDDLILGRLIPKELY